jgi:hypothetical protein
VQVISRGGRGSSGNKEAERDRQNML